MKEQPVFDIRQEVRAELERQTPVMVERYLVTHYPDIAHKTTILETDSPYDPIVVDGKTYISLDAFSQFITDFSGEHAPCMFEEIQKSWGKENCNEPCFVVRHPSCWGAYLLWWMEQRKENE